ncbi:TonB-dependent receptor plug domain-containing protein [Mucilaginibacter sp. UR6-11]|uniref:TonB-dependent receptor plug domain-containing protein n=1 Tax=Mucilaginibacter sp. UR6-11 TaxID=1435644 RepID=UPI001E38DB22|nr:TonB-dependent receptor plug domain-containing protein [Mucilaginibacter sp. UR6-11]MCC8425184.1 TonB-dependent receptor plug domain-containing protein [Mucilaginibacter sp. UR6-11]
MIATKSRLIVMFLALPVLFTGLAGFSLNDDPVILKIVGQLDKWATIYPTEKVYLQLDKPYYSAGDNIWFKAYVTLNNRHRLSALSKVLNVDLIDTHDSVKRRIKLAINNGVAWGDFTLPDTLIAGNYHIRAYTNWMRNAGPDYYFDKTIAVGNAAMLALQKNKSAAKTGNGGPDIRFFPESGNLVNGLRSKVAIKAVSPTGLGVDITGSVIDNENNVVSNFTTRHLGMGIFALTPQAGKTYRALITYLNGKKQTVNLPRAISSGYVLTINTLDSANISVKVAASANMTNSGQFYIVAQSGGEALYIANNKTVGNTFMVNVPAAKFPSGIVQFTLFSATGEPLSERLAFVRHQNDLLNLHINANPVSTVREKYKIDLDAQNNGKPAEGNFSVAVLDESKVSARQTDETTILAHLLLTSDLRGYIENPAYYFENANETTRADLDVLMLTQGYRRFEWKPLLAGAIKAPLYQAEDDIEISGMVTTPGKKPMPNAKVFLFSRTNGFFFRDTVANEQGRFVFKNLTLTDSTRFVLQARTPKNGTYAEIFLDEKEVAEPNGRQTSYNDYNQPDLLNYVKYSKELTDQEIKYGVGNHTILLKQVNVRAKLQKPVLSYSSNISGAGNADQVLTNDMLYKYGPGDLEMFLQTRVNGIYFVDGYPYSRRGQGVDSGKMLVLINGVESYNGVADLMTGDVGSVEILKGANHSALFGPRAMNGIMIINLKTGIDAMNNLSKNSSPDVARFISKGYYAAREFYSPQYDDPKTNKTLADLRTTIYWNPNVSTDSNGHASFEYYNAGTPGTYRVIVEGIDANGHLGHEVYRYKVQGIVTSK